MKKLLGIAIFIVCFVFSSAWAGPECIYVPIDIKVTKFENVNLHIVEQKCINYPKNEYNDVQEAYFVTQNPDESSNTIIEIPDDGSRLTLEGIKVLDGPPEFPYMVIHAWGSYNELHIFSLTP